MNWKPATRSRGWGSAASSVVVIGLASSINLLVPPPSHAAEPPPGPTPVQRAKQHYLRGESYFKAHDFSAAMGEYQSGYEEKADPVFIFNIAQCQRLLGHPGPALQSYRRYLRDAPDGAGRAIAERQIAELDRLTGGAGATSSTTPGAAATTGAGTPPSTDAPGVTSPGPTVEARQTPPTPSAPPSAAGRDRFAAPPSSGAVSVRPPATTPSITVVDPTSPTVAGATAFPVRSDEESARPIYRRWWFWVAAGALSLATIVAVSAASSGGKPACDADRVCR